LLKKHFKKVVVISTRPYIPRIFSPFLSPSRARDSMARDYIYDNVEVYFIRSVVLPFKSSKNKWGVSAYSSAKSILKKIDFKPDIIHAHRTWPPGFVAMRLSEDFSVPFIVTAHGHDAYGLPSQSEFYRDTISKTLNAAHTVISVSQANINSMKKSMKLKGNNLVYLPNGFDMAKFHPISKSDVRKKLKLPLDRSIFIAVGHLEKVKGYVVLINAMKKVVDKHEKAYLVIVGGGSEKTSIEKAIKDNNLQEHVLLAGPKPHEEIPEWINAADYFTLSSFNEGMPTVLLEAIGCGKPYVGTDVGGIPEIIINDKLGLLVPPKEPKQLAVAMEKALKLNWDENYILEHAKRYTWEKISDKVLNIYKDALALKNYRKQ